MDLQWQPVFIFHSLYSLILGAIKHTLSNPKASPCSPCLHIALLNKSARGDFSQWEEILARLIGAAKELKHKHLLDQGSREEFGFAIIETIDTSRMENTVRSWKLPLFAYSVAILASSWIIELEFFCIERLFNFAKQCFIDRSDRCHILLFSLCHCGQRFPFTDLCWA